MERCGVRSWTEESLSADVDTLPVDAELVGSMLVWGPAGRGREQPCARVAPLRLLGSCW